MCGDLAKLMEYTISQCPLWENDCDYFKIVSEEGGMAVLTLPQRVGSKS